MTLRMCNTIGKFIEENREKGHYLGEFHRAKGSINLRKPFYNVKLPTKRFHVFFKYERLLSFCYMYGQINHQMKICEEVKGNKEGDFFNAPYELLTHYAKILKCF